MTQKREQIPGGINRSMPPSVVIPELAYPDVRQAVNWLCHWFGFVERLRIGDHRAQLIYGEGSVIVTGQSVDSDVLSSIPAGIMIHSVMVRVPDVDNHYEHAKKSGAQIINPPTNYPYGERQYSVYDLGGHRWTFSQTINDIDPSSWGGKLFD